MPKIGSAASEKYTTHTPGACGRRRRSTNRCHHDLPLAADAFRIDQPSSSSKARADACGKFFSPDGRSPGLTGDPSVFDGVLDLPSSLPTTSSPTVCNRPWPEASWLSSISVQSHVSFVAHHHDNPIKA